jgi:hypothetical protein
MVQRREQLCFAFKPQRAVAVPMEVFGKHFDCYLAAETRVRCFPDHAHASDPKQGRDSVVRQGLTDHGRSLVGE